MARKRLMFFIFTKIEKQLDIFKIQQGVFKKDEDVFKKRLDVRPQMTRRFDANDLGSSFIR